MSYLKALDSFAVSFYFKLGGSVVLHLNKTKTTSCLTANYQVIFKVTAISSIKPLYIDFTVSKLSRESTAV